MSMCEEWAMEDMLGLLFFPRMNWIACVQKYPRIYITELLFLRITNFKISVAEPGRSDPVIFC